MQYCIEMILYWNIVLYVHVMTECNQSLIVQTFFQYSTWMLGMPTTILYFGRERNMGVDWTDLG